jgi:aryl-alcohol dehydrogenase-like predicted oxidoreductase
MSAENRVLRDADPIDYGQFYLFGRWAKVANFAIVERLRKLSARIGIPMVRLALSWVLQQPSVSGALIGARHEGHIDNAADALANPLDPTLIAEMDDFSSPSA